MARAKLVNRDGSHEDLVLVDPPLTYKRLADIRAEQAEATTNQEPKPEQPAAPVAHAEAVVVETGVVEEPKPRRKKKAKADE